MAADGIYARIYHALRHVDAPKQAVDDRPR